jgi:hypothetical protein
MDLSLGHIAQMNNALQQLCCSKNSTAILQYKFSEKQNECILFLPIDKLRIHDEYGLSAKSSKVCFNMEAWLNAPAS